MGERINDESSIYYWAAKNKIPVFSPALTDGSLGDMLYFHSFRNPGLVMDIISDLRRLNTMAVKANNSGIIIAGGGLVKHHICNANLMVTILKSSILSAIKKSASWICNMDSFRYRQTTEPFFFFNFYPIRN